MVNDEFIYMRETLASRKGTCDAKNAKKKKDRKFTIFTNTIDFIKKQT